MTEKGEVDDLVVAAQAGDAAAFGVLYQRFVRLVAWKVATKCAPDVVDDVVSETWLRAWARLGQYQSGSFAGWLLTIADHLVADHYRSGRREVLCDELDGLGGVFAPAADVGVLAGAVERELWRCVDLLPTHYVACLDHRVWGGLSVDDTAEVMGVSSSSVRAMKHKAVARLRKLVSVELVS